MPKITVAATVAAVLCLSGTAFVTTAHARTDPATVTADSAPALNDATIIAIFDEANTADIETGQLAVKKGTTKAVRDFAAMLVRDHSAVRQQGRDLAKKLGVTPTAPKPDQGAVDHAAAMKQLRALSGPAFDKAFLAHEVAFHKAVIDAVTSTLLPTIQNADLKALVVKVAPAFQAHMLAAQNLESKLGQ